MSTLKSTIVDLSDKIKADISIAKDGTIEVAPDLFYKHLPEGVTRELVEAAADYQGEFMVAATNAIGEHAIPFFKKHKAHEKLNVHVPLVGKDTLELKLYRSKTYPGMVRDGVKGPETTKHCVIDAKLNVHEADDSIGQFKIARKALNVNALAAYGE